jgi:hypothetical protein
VTTGLSSCAATESSGTNLLCAVRPRKERPLAVVIDQALLHTPQKVNRAWLDRTKLRSGIRSGIREDRTSWPPERLLIPRSLVRFQPGPSKTTRRHAGSISRLRSSRSGGSTSPARTLRPVDAGERCVGDRAAANRARRPLDGRQPARPPRRGRLPLLCGELDLPQAYVQRCHLNAFVLRDELECLLERERPRWDQPDELIRVR